VVHCNDPQNIVGSVFSGVNDGKNVKEGGQKNVFDLNHFTTKN
jgi:hypothetical protein